MNLRSFATMSAVAMFVLGGCVVVTSNGNGGGGSGGSGNVGNEGGSSTGGKGGAGGSGPGVGGGGGVGGAPACVGCGEFVTAGGTLCGDSQKIYDELALCACGDAMTKGPCQDVCGADLCMNKDPGPDCQACILNDKIDPMTMMPLGCAPQYSSCSNDI